MVFMLFPIFAIIVLLSITILLVVIRVTRSGFAYSWLIAALGVLLTWALLFFSRVNIPTFIPLISWHPEAFYPNSPTLLVDQISWSFALALVTLALSTFLTGVARTTEEDGPVWASSLFFTAIGLLAVLAGNPLTLILAWAALDIGELLIGLWRVKNEAKRERVIIVFSVRISGIFLLMLGANLAGLYESTLTFDVIPQEVSVYLLLAACVRLGAIILEIPLLKDDLLPRGLGTTLHLVLAGACLVLLARISLAGVPSSLAPYLLIISVIIGLVAGISWLYAKDELGGRPYWILGMSAFALVAAVRGQSEASLAWGLATIFSGGLLFLYTARHRNLLPLIVIGLFGFSGLPFSPMWFGMRLYTPPFNPILLILVLPHAMLLSGYLWHALQPGQTLVGVERWVWVIYPWGLSLLPLVYFLVGGWGKFTGVLTDWTGLLSIVLPGIVTFVLAALIFIGLRKGLGIPKSAQSIIQAGFSLKWLRRLIWSGFRALGSAFDFLSKVLEGEGGVLWALLLLILLLVFLARGSLVGI